MTDLTRRQILLGGTALAAAGLLPAIPRTPLTPRMAMMRSAIADDLPQPDYVIRLGTNENPYGPSRVALKAINNNLQLANRYSANPRPLIALMAEENGVAPEQVMVGTGSNEILKIAAMLAALRGGSVVGPAPTYQSLLRYAEAAGMAIVRVPVDDSLHIDLDAMRAALRDDTRLVYLVNPNNPIPTIIEKQAMREFVLEMSEKYLVFVDEAYHEYADDPDYGSMLDLVAAGHNNIIISRTASKIHGLAGLRIGFGFAHADLITEMNRRKTGDTHVLALEAARASYLDKTFQEFALEKNRESRRIMDELCTSLDLRHVTSNTNFTFIETGMDNSEFRATMREHGIMTARDFAPFNSTWSRISLSRPEEMAYFAQIYRRLYS